MHGDSLANPTDFHYTMLGDDEEFRISSNLLELNELYGERMLVEEALILVLQKN